MIFVASINVQLSTVMTKLCWKSIKCPVHKSVHNSVHKLFAKTGKKTCKSYIHCCIFAPWVSTLNMKLNVETFFEILIHQKKSIVRYWTQVQRCKSIYVKNELTVKTSYLRYCLRKWAMRWITMLTVLRSLAKNRIPIGLDSINIIMVRLNKT